MVRSQITQDELIHTRDSEELPRRPSADDAATVNENLHDGPRNSAEVGPRKLTPPSVLRRDATGTSQPKNSPNKAGNTQGKCDFTECLHVGLAGIEPATFTLSV